MNSEGELHTSKGELHTSKDELYTSKGELHISKGELHTSKDELHTSKDTTNFQLYDLSGPPYTNDTASSAWFLNMGKPGTSYFGNVDFLQIIINYK